MVGWFVLLMIVAGLVYGAWRIGLNSGKKSTKPVQTVPPVEVPTKAVRLVVTGGLDDLDVDTVELGDSFCNRLPHCEIFAYDAFAKAGQISHDREGQYLMRLCQQLNAQLFSSKKLKIVPKFYYDNGYESPGPKEGNFQPIHKISWLVLPAENYGG